jgi:hypothetical protein
MMGRGKKIGVLTFHNCINYGSYWQARCLVEGLRRQGHDAELLDHESPSVRRAEVRCAFQPKLPERTSRAEMRQYASKTRKFVDAIRRLPLSRRFGLDDPDAMDRYDAIVVGSDEVWNFRHPWYGSKPLFFGDGVKADRLVSYAASFGNHSAWSGIDPEWARKLDRFSAISVRDHNSWHLVHGSTGREPEIVLDPVLQFADVAEQDPADIGSYALVYGHGFPPFLQAAVRRWSERTGIRLLSVGYTNAWADEQQAGAGPLEFARLMSGAEAVITNFFHGCVFALLNGKPWATAPSDYRSIKIPDLAKKLGAGHRILTHHTSDAQLAELLGTPVLPAVAQRVSEYRARSTAFLDAALS